jgi:single-strand DNA-binding protein
MELNKVMLIGNLTRDPEIRATSSGLSVAKLGLAVNRRMPPNRETGERRDETLFVDVSVWDKQAEFCRNYLHKGSRVFIEGRLKMDQWQDKDTGQNRSRIEVVADRIQFAESKAEADQRTAHGGESSGESQGYQPAPARRMAAPAPEPDGGANDTADDLPF